MTDTQDNPSTEDGQFDQPALLCVISPHEKGFWMADVYEQGCDEEGIPPLWFCTGRKNGHILDVINKANKEFPGIRFVRGVTGVCGECGEDHFDLETECNCGGFVDDT